MIFIGTNIDTFLYEDDKIRKITDVDFVLSDKGADTLLNSKVEGNNINRVVFFKAENFDNAKSMTNKMELKNFSQVSEKMFIKGVDF